MCSAHETLIHLPFRHESDLPPGEETQDKYPEALVRYLLGAYTKPGDKVLDPFAGLGTTLFVAEEMGRIPFGIEADPRRHAWAAGQVENWMYVIHGDAGCIVNYAFPKMDFCITSPPYMPVHHKWNPLYGGDPDFAGYDQYLARIRDIFSGIAKIMKRGRFVIIQADNLYKTRSFTPLVRDISRIVSPHLKPVAETVIAWQNPEEFLKLAGNEGIAPTHTQCLIFKKC